MWFKGNKSGVAIFYVCWGAKGASYNVEAYQTLNGLVKWIIGKAMSEMPVHRIGMMVITETGPVEKGHWTSRKKFLQWAKPLVGFEIPEI